MSHDFQGGYSPNGASEMYGSIGGHYSSNYGNIVSPVLLKI